jgi:hypothetical protein
MPATLENRYDAERQVRLRRLVRLMAVSISAVVLLTAVFTANASTDRLAVMGAIAWGLAVVAQTLIGLIALRWRRPSLRARRHYEAGQ